MKPSDKDCKSTHQPIRLQVFLSHNGVCSRRQALDIIMAGKVTVNRKVIKEPSTKVVSGKDAVAVDGRLIRGKSYDYILLNKPKGYVTTKADKYAEKTVIGLLPKKFKHLSPVGRLDKETEGLLLFTNDGDTAYKLTHPKFNIDKVYSVKVYGKLMNENKKRLENGVILEGKKTAPARIRNVKYFKNFTEFLITIHEGKKRQIRKMMQKVGHHVTYLNRLSVGPLELGNIRTGQWRSLTQSEIKSIKK